LNPSEHPTQDKKGKGVAFWAHSMEN